MRPYMLWLTRIYTGTMFPGVDGTARARAGLDDWFAYQNEQWFYVQAWRA